LNIGGASPHVIRPAVEDDAAPLSAFAEQTFRDTFGAFNTARDLDLHCGRYFTPSAQRREILDPEACTLLLERDKALIGYAQIGRGAAPPCVRGAKPIELRRFYVLKSWHGAGLGRDLMTAVFARCIALGADAVWLGVWERNPRAIGFYRKWGFAEVGEHEFVLGTDAQRDLVMTSPTSGNRERREPIRTS
jgi:GNAT superfamily N-acetyltransferase